MTTISAPVESLREGDLIDVEPLLVSWGARDENYDADLIAAQSELANVETVATNQDGSVTIYSDLMNIAVPAGTLVQVERDQD